MIFLILPNQLFDIKHFTKSFKYILWECPHFFTDYNYNKKKLLLHRATMRYQYDLMKKNGYSVVYVEFGKKLAETEQYTLYYPINKLDILKLPRNTIIYDKDTPNLLLTREHIKRYREKTGKFFFNAFYMWSKKELNIIPKIKSQDKLNRQKPKNIIHYIISIFTKNKIIIIVGVKTIHEYREEFIFKLFIFIYTANIKLHILKGFL